MSDQAPLQIERWPIDKVKQSKRNPKVHSEAAIKELAESYQEFGDMWPVLVDKKGELIAGHRRHLAKKYLGATEIDVIQASHLTADQVRAFRLADTKLSLTTPFDPGILRDELMHLQKVDFPLASAGFDDAALKMFLAVPNTGRSDPDAIQHIPKVISVRAGDLWTLGNHRLLCGSSIVKAEVDTLLNGAVPHLMVGDPPYGVDYNPEWRNQVPGVFGDGKVKMTGKVQNDGIADWTEAWRLFPGEVAYIWHASLTNDIVIQSLEAADFERRAHIIWRKPHFQISRGHYHWQHECCWYAVKKGGKGYWNGSRKETTVWDIAGMNPAGRNTDEGNEKTEHGTQKPIECMERPMLNNSKPGDSVYDPFCGSGSTIIGGERSGRVVYAMEIDPAYVQLAIERWQKFTGELATCDGKTLDQMAAARKSGKATGKRTDENGGNRKPVRRSRGKPAQPVDRQPA